MQRERQHVVGKQAVFLYQTSVTQKSTAVPDTCTGFESCCKIIKLDTSAYSLDSSKGPVWNR
jgi:hypothetical protein